jgi:NMD protein affecting ribosome stability and mRNA decay
MKRQDEDFFAAVERDLQSWRSTHPRATFAEIEAAVEERIRQVRARLLEETVDSGFQEEHPVCSQCGATMRPRTRAKREVIIQGEEAVPVGGTYVVCPACGSGLFPPG